jgi:hypothetical protein
VSIHEHAQQLAALAEQVPDEHAQVMMAELNTLQQQVAAVLGDTATAAEIHGAIAQATEQCGTLAAALEQVKQTILLKAHYHQQG